MKKTVRQSKIIDIIEKYDVETQDDLVDLLNKHGFEATQSTVSRDIRELKLTKMVCDSGKQKYVYLASAPEIISDKYKSVLKEGFISMDIAGGLLVIKTVSGMAMAVAAAIDAMKQNEIIGSIAGDDTIMCAVKTIDDAHSVMNAINSVVKK